MNNSLSPMVSVKDFLNYPEYQISSTTSYWTRILTPKLYDLFLCPIIKFPEHTLLELKPQTSHNHYKLQSGTLSSPRQREVKSILAACRWRSMSVRECSPTQWARFRLFPFSLWVITGISTTRHGIEWVLLGVMGVMLIGLMRCN